MLSTAFTFWKAKYSDKNWALFYSDQTDDLEIIFYVDKLLHVSSTHTELASQSQYAVSAFCFSNLCAVSFKISFEGIIGT